MEIVIDRDVCIGSGMCAFTAPEVFDQDELDGRVVLRRTNPAAEHDDAVRESVTLCPSGALSIRQATR